MGNISNRNDNGRRRRSKKRKFQGNQHHTPEAKQPARVPNSAGKSVTTSKPTSQPQVNVAEAEQVSASRRKLITSPTVTKTSTSRKPASTEKATPSGFRLIDMTVLAENIVKSCKCKKCGASVTLCEDISQDNNGLAVKLLFACDNVLCTMNNSFMTSKKIETGNRGNSPYEVNRRAVLAFREIGSGYADMETFCMVMNIPKPMNKKTYDNHIEQLADACESVAQSSMNEVAKSIRTNAGTRDDVIADGAVSVDGTWQKRIGHNSLNGIVTAIDVHSGKVLDYEILTSKCKQCQYWRKHEEDPGYEEWVATHGSKCKANHTKSAPAMEPVGAVNIFARSVKLRKLRYTTYVGDGDSSSFANVVSSKPYKKHSITKKECVGHIQKRCGGRLRKKKKRMGNTKLKDGKTIGGKARLTNGIMDTLQNYFGMAIRGNKGDAQKMKNDIIASLYHVASTDNKPKHDKCPTGEDSWCGYQRDLSMGTQTYKHKNGIDEAVVEEILPIYQDLTSGPELERSVDCYTQNPNECLNGVIWSRIPKETFVGRTTLRLGVALAASQFNDGKQSILSLLQKQSINPGIYTTAAASNIDIRRIQNSDAKSSEKGKKERAHHRAVRKRFKDRTEMQEGTLYESGAF